MVSISAAKWLFKDGQKEIERVPRFIFKRIKTKLSFHSSEFLLTKDRETVYAVHKGPSCVDFDDEWCCGQCLQKNLGSYTSTSSLKLTVDVDTHAFNAPASRRIIGYQRRNLRWGKVFTNVFAYEHRNHATRAGTLFASIMMRLKLAGVRRVYHSAAVLSSRPHPGCDGQEQRA